MKTFVYSIAFLGLCFFSKVNAAEPTTQLGEDTAKRLIADMLEISATSIKVATVVQGAKDSQDGFEEQQVRRATVIHPVPENGKMVRRVRCYDFSWSSQYGWFYKEIRNSRGGEEVWIWSETEGRVIVK